MTWTDYRVECDDCDAQYTPKCRQKPEKCAMCRSTNINAKKIGPHYEP
jgi:hypothetical protein